MHETNGDVVDGSDDASPLVSIICPAFNCASYLPATVASVLAQTWRRWEMLIVDDRSTDGTAEIARAYAAADPRFRVWTTSTQGGAAEARNLALGEARGRFIAFLDSDDLWLPEKLAVQVRFMLRTGVALSYARFYCMVDGEDALELRPDFQAVSTYRSLLRNNCIGCLTAMVDTAQTGRLRMPSLRRRQDYGLWLGILRRARRAYGIPIPLAIYRIRRDSLSRNKLTGAGFLWRIYRDCERLPPHLAGMYFAAFAVNGVRNRAGAGGGARPQLALGARGPQVLPAGAG